MALSKKEIARERILTLFELAEFELKRENPERTRRYVRLARKISMKVQEPIEKDLKRKFCKKCDMLIIPGVSCGVSANKRTKTVDIKCFNCNNIKRYSYAKKHGGNGQKSGEAGAKPKE
ncbi:MAG: ribonuclease P protein component 4 [Candidatus Aenigmatarchaeota archaeon]